MQTEDFYRRTTIPDFAHTEPSITIPSRIGPYKIESLLSKGAASLLYLAVHPKTNKPLVIKVLSPKFLTNKVMVGRFLKEAEIISITSHPNIVKWYGQGKWDRGLYIAMEFIQGISLKQLIQQNALSLKRSLEITLQVAYALCHLHTHGVIHRDVKPENILITESGDIKVIDFGIAQLQNETSTLHEKFMGTPIYMSPEQKKNPPEISFSSDIYSLGIITYELFIGKLSYGVIHASLLPAGLKQILEKALRDDPKERYQDIVDFISNLTEYSKSEEVKYLTKKDHFFESLHHAKTLFVSEKPSWDAVNIGLAYKQTPLSSLYIDFFALSSNRYAIVMAECMRASFSCFIRIASLKGMFQIAMQRSYGMEEQPTMILQEINQVMLKEMNPDKIALSLLILNPDHDQLYFVSLKHNNLWHFPDKAQKPRILITPNSYLGKEGIFLQTADNWHPKDVTIIYSLGAFPPKSTEIEKEKIEKRTIEHLNEPPQKQADNLLKKVNNTSTKSRAVLSISRVF